MTRNIHAAARMILAALSFVLLGLACDNPANGKTGGDRVTGPVTMAKFNAIRVDREGSGGMTPAEIIAVMGFEGSRVVSVSSDFSTTLQMFFRESPRKFIYVGFNSDHRATSKSLRGIQVITLAKYQSIQTGAATGASLTDVNSIMGFDGLRSRYAVLTGNQTQYYWGAGSFHRVTVTFNAGGKAVKKSLSGGFPGMVTLAKYNRIAVGASISRASFPATVTGAGTSKTEVDRIMGFSGTHQRSRGGMLRTYRWAESAEKYIEVKFLVYGTSSKASSARASGLPGAVDKP